MDLRHMEKALIISYYRQMFVQKKEYHILSLSENWVFLKIFLMILKKCFQQNT